jgi:VIT1/CCC1 family predicted Fe2+/Mn2+ transporter
VEELTVHHRVLAHLGSGHVSRVVYGSIIGLALVLTMEVHPPEPGAAVGALLATALAVALAELYSEQLGGRARASMGGHREPLRAIVADAVAVAFGVAFPSVFFLAAVLDVMAYETAFTVAKWSGLALIAGYGFLAARLSGAGMLQALLEAAAVGAIAAVLIGLKALVH